MDGSMATKMLSNVSKIALDKVTYNGTFKPFKYRCDNELNSLSVNKDFTQVVVAGRTVFKILNIRESGFSDAINLRTNKSRQDPVYSISDVTWHQNDENMLASAAANGTVVVWSISNRKKELVFTDHKRSVNRVTFHGSEHNQLLSASQDGVVMIHDIRQQNVCITFGNPGSEIVKDAQFCPPNMGYFTFASASGNSIQMWDMRRPDRNERQFVAHNGPVYTLDWHPHDKNTLATGGRDKMIKVWDLSTSNVRNVYTITNIAPVAAIKWRPQRNNHLASCYVQWDNSLNVWDVERPYIPFARFGGHDNTATCIQWREDCHTFLTCGKDGNVIQHVFADAKRPADDLNLAAVDISINGHVGYINSEKNEAKNKKVAKSRQFKSVQSSLCVFEKYHTQEDEEDPSSSLFMTEEEQFVHLAKQYHLDGNTFEELCFHNSQVADAYNKPDVAECWRMVATLLCTRLCSNPIIGHMTRTSSISKSNNDSAVYKEHSIKSALKHPRDKRTNGLAQIDNNDGPLGSNDENSEVEGEVSEVDQNLQELNVTTSVLFGEGGMGGNSVFWYNATGMLDHSNYTYDCINNIPAEGFRVRNEFELKAMAELRPMVMEENDITPVAADSESSRHQHSDHHESSHPTLIVKTDDVTSNNSIDFAEDVANMIKNYAERGDVQTMVTMLIVIGEAIHPYLDESHQESWFLAYIDLLSQFELWQIANEVIKYSKLLGVSSLNQESTVIHTFCTICSRPMDRTAWLCDKCKRITNVCSLCHYPVNGCIAWCQGCGHGGHKEHLEAWFKTSSMCPAGCGHQCEFV